MGKPQWTDEQKKVIELRDRNILVSAAAGSGKTAVLVERIIAEITEGEHPKDIDRLLVVTFTKAAAAEMRARVGAALEKRLLLEPDNKHIQKQASLLHTAQITTIDSFCQFVIKNYFHVIHLDPSFRVGEETELELMKQEVLAKLLEEKYKEARETGDGSFFHFTETLAEGRTDRAVEKMVLSLYEVSTSYAWRTEWLNGCVKLYEAKSVEAFEQGEWLRPLLQYLDWCVEEYLGMAQRAEELCLEENGPYPYLDAVRDDIQMLTRLQGANSYGAYAKELAAYRPMKLKAVRDKGVSVTQKEHVKFLRETYLKKGIGRLKERFFFQDSEQMLLQIQAMAPAVRELVKLTISFGEAFAARKRDEGILDFADMEQFALQILLVRDENGVRPSETALELQEYYEEILIDEYQDSNSIQELLLTSLSRAPKARPYLFMVGDVKQSIYKFRLARPELFLEKYRRYTLEDSPYQKIDLHANFRSRKQVLSFANYIFEQIMQERLGGICYDDAASLVAGATYPKTEQRTAGAVQMILIEQESEEDAFLQKKSLEAATIGAKIRDMVQGENPLCVREGDGYRPARYADIAILLRSLSGWAEEFVEQLNDMGIPAYADTKTGFFTSLEVETALNLLRVIDNPRQDIPLVSVLRSCLFQVTDDELAQIGAMETQLNFWDKLLSYLAQHGREDALGVKLSRFTKMLAHYQEYEKLHSVYDLLQKIYRETEYYDIMAAMPAGERRQANLDILLQQAVTFAENGRRGVYGFMRYIEEMQSSDVDFGEASVNGENTDAVRIMTIHKSKGLEFLVVFVAGMGKQFNLMDARAATILDGDYGVGCDFVDTERRIKQPTLVKRFLSNQVVLNTLAEEIRILYVALTRAKEQLIVTGTAPRLLDKLSVWQEKSEILGFTQLSSAQTYLDWLVPALLKRQSLALEIEEHVGDGERKGFCCRDGLCEIAVCFPEEIVQTEKQELADNVQDYRRLMEWEAAKTYDEAMQAALERRISYQYPYRAEAQLPAKVSVSELKRRAMEQAEQLSEENTVYVDAAGADEAGQDEMPRPAFLAQKQKIRGAQRGTLYHLAMEHLPYAAFAGQEDLEAAVRQYFDALVQDGYLRQQERDVLEPKRLLCFLQSSIGQRMMAAAQAGTLKREQQFMIGVKANEVYADLDSTEMIMVQGIIDAYFEEQDGIVLVDYKTDFVLPGQEDVLTARYRVQMDYYARALRGLTGKKVTERIIYSFALGKELFL